MKWGPKNGILIFVDNGPKAISFHAGVVLVSIFFSFIQIGLGHAAVQYAWFLSPTSIASIGTFQIPFTLPKSYS